MRAIVVDETKISPSCTEPSVSGPSLKAISEPIDAPLAESQRTTNPHLTHENQHATTPLANPTSREKDRSSPQYLLLLASKINK